MDGWRRTKEELITWIAGWMDFWCWRYLWRAWPGDSRPACPSTIFPPSFDIDFQGHFGMDLASIFDTFWTFVHHFCFKTSTIEKTWIFIQIPWTNGALEPWKIQLLRGTLEKHTEIACADFPFILYRIFNTFPHYFASLFACFFMFSWRRISDAFLGAFFCGFWHQTCAQMHPKMDQKKD